MKNDVEVLVEVLGKEVTGDVEKIAINFPNPFLVSVDDPQRNIEIHVHFIGMPSVTIMGSITDLGR